MGRLGGVVLCCIGGLALAACGTQLDRAKSLNPEGSKFDQSLYAGYVDLSNSEISEGDYEDSDVFASRAIASGTAGGVAPEAMAARKLPEDKVGELTGARARLMDSLAKGAGEKVPNQAAKAQVMFDCWMQEQEENFQPDDIAACQSAFYDAMADVEGAMRPKAVAAGAPPPADPKRFVVYFSTDSSKIDAAAAAVLEEAKAAAAKLQSGQVKLVAGADTVGATPYNQTLSERRADAVVKAMLEGGIPAGAINAQAFGETKLAKPTPDEVDEIANRRVEIVVEIVGQ